MARRNGISDRFCHTSHLSARFGYQLFWDLKNFLKDYHVISNFYVIHSTIWRDEYYCYKAFLLTYFSQLHNIHVTEILNRYIGRHSTHFYYTAQIIFQIMRMPSLTSKYYLPTFTSTSNIRKWIPTTITYLDMLLFVIASQGMDC